MMPATPSDVLTRLRAANPAPVSPERPHDPIAQATLERILNDPGPDAAPRSSRRVRRTAASGRRSVPSLVIVLGLMVACAGGALAATDPFGWWSANRHEARYGSNPAVHVATPKAQQIRCQPSSDGRFTCTPERYVCTGLSTSHPFCRLPGTGQAYNKIDAIRPPVRASFTRASILAFINRGLANHTLTASVAATIRADLARVPDSFFTEFRLASRYGTYHSGSVSQGRELVPPAGVPNILVCQNAKNGLSCGDLNGDLNAPIGAGAYAAVPGKGWRTAPAPKVFGGGPPPGIHFSSAETQLVFDLGMAGTTTQSSSRDHRAKSIPGPPAHTSTSHKTGQTISPSAP